MKNLIMLLVATLTLVVLLNEPLCSEKTCYTIKFHDVNNTDPNQLKAYILKVLKEMGAYDVSKPIQPDLEIVIDHLKNEVIVCSSQFDVWQSQIINALLSNLDNATDDQRSFMAKFLDFFLDKLRELSKLHFLKSLTKRH